MKIIYLTTAMKESEFPTFLSYWENGLNTSNQNFHASLISALSKKNEVITISVRPFNRDCSLKQLKSNVMKEDNITWFHLAGHKNRYIRYLMSLSQTKNIFKHHHKDAVVIVDSLNLSLVKIATSLSKKYQLPLVVTVTDSPNYISYVDDDYRKQVLENAKNADGFICLTKELNNMFNKSNKPFTIMHGIIDENHTKTETEGDYFFYAGNMMEKFGAYTLIDAFNELKLKDTKLIIAAHHYEKEKIENIIKNNPHIIFLGTLARKEVIKYENGSIANINPRPFLDEFDKYSIPSKTMEYASAHSLTISTISNELKPIFNDSILWLNNGNKEEIKDALLKAKNISKKEREQIIKKARETALAHYSKDKIAKQLQELLFTVSK